MSDFPRAVEGLIYVTMRMASRLSGRRFNRRGAGSQVEPRQIRTQSRRHAYCTLLDELEPLTSVQ